MTLRASSLSFAWPGQSRLLDEISISLKAGELVALVGANGSGKSTLLRILAGLLAPASGEVALDGRRIDGMPSDERARSVAFLPQTVRPLYSMTVREMVELARHPWRGIEVEGQPVELALAQCDVLELATRRFDELSGGERQRALLAGALAQGGRVLLLDEPTAALDLPPAVSVIARLRDQLPPHRSALVVTHDLNLAAAWADRVVLLHSGRLIAEGSPREVIRQDLLDLALGEGVEVIAHPMHGQPRVLPKGRH